MTTTQTLDSNEIVPLRSADLPGGDVPLRILIAPWGAVESTSGAFVVDDESARLAVEAFAAHGTDVPIDYEHQTLGGEFAAPNGQAPAAGWIKSLVAEPGVGLFAQVEWTEPAMAQLAARQYRYLSPVAIVRRADRKLIGLHSAALTNKPAIIGMAPIVSRDSAAHAAAWRELRRRLSLGDESDETTVLIAAAQRLSETDANEAANKAEQRVAEAQRTGKLSEAQREWALNLALKDAAAFEAWLRTAPVLIPLGRTQPPTDAPAAGNDHAREAAARAEFRAHPELAALTTEEAYVADATRSKH